MREEYEKEKAWLLTRLEHIGHDKPHLAAYLLRGADARMMHLVEAGAFSFARARVRVQDEGQTLARPFIASAMPEALPPQPALTIAQISPRPETYHNEPRSDLTATVDETTLHFQVRWPVRVCPIELSHARLERIHADRQVLRIDLTGRDGARLGHVLPDILRVFVHTEPRVALMLLYSLRSAGEAIRIEAFNAAGQRTHEGFAPATAFKWVRVDTTEPPLVLGPLGRFTSSSLLRDLYRLPESYSFFDIVLEQQLSAFRNRETSRITITLPLRQVIESASNLDGSNFRLFCSPAVNQYSAKLEPINATDGETEWPLAVSRRPHAEILHVESIFAQAGRNPQSRVAIPPWERTTWASRTAVRYMLQQVPSTSSSKTELHISFVGDGFFVPAPGDVVGGEVLASDGALASRLAVGNVASSDKSATNITRVAPSWRASLRELHAWRLGGYGLMDLPRFVRPRSLQAFMALHGGYSSASDATVGVPRFIQGWHTREYALDGGLPRCGDSFTIEADATSCTEAEAWLQGDFLSRALAERNEKLRPISLELRLNGQPFARYVARTGTCLQFPFG